LHLGHLVGVLGQWLSYQDTHECYFMVADVQALATHRDREVQLDEDVREVVLDWLAVGLDPARSDFVLQSRIPELAELTVYLQSIVPTGELRSNPTSREEARMWGKGGFDDGVNAVDVGFLAYPVAQAADILIFTSPPTGNDEDTLIVPVGFDQVPHVDFAARVARRFNEVYAPTFAEPEAKLAVVDRLPGLDGGSKMGKSSRNAILLKDSDAIVEGKVRAMFTDPLRVNPDDPGHPDDCPCFLFRQACSNDLDRLEARREDCKLGRTDCEDCRETLVARVQEVLAPIRERRAQYEERPTAIAEFLHEGTNRARRVARQTMERVRDAMGLTYPDLMYRGS
jgi:tryptophanyl-tRNA synthetase